MAMPASWRARLPKELWFEQFPIYTRKLEPWLQPFVERNRRWWERISFQFMPWYEAPSGRRFKMLWLTWFPQWKASRVFVVDRNLEPAPMDEARAAVRNIMLASAISGYLSTEVFRMYVPENMKMSNLYLDAITRCREALTGDPKGEEFFPALDKAHAFYTYLRDNNEEANRLMVETFVGARQFQERFRTHGFAAVVRHGEPEAVLDPLLRFGEIRWRYAHCLRGEYLSPCYRLTHLVINRRLCKKLPRQELLLLREAQDTMEAVLTNYHNFHAAKSGHEAILGHHEWIIGKKLAALAVPRQGGR